MNSASHVSYIQPVLKKLNVPKMATRLSFQSNIEFTARVRSRVSRRTRNTEQLHFNWMATMIIHISVVKYNNCPLINILKSPI